MYPVYWKIWGSATRKELSNPRMDKDVKGTAWGCMTTNRHRLGGQGWQCQDWHHQGLLALQVPVMSNSCPEALQTQFNTKLGACLSHYKIMWVWFFSTKLHGSQVRTCDNIKRSDNPDWQQENTMSFKQGTQVISNISLLARHYAMKEVSTPTRIPVQDGHLGKTALTQKNLRGGAPSTWAAVQPHVDSIKHFTLRFLQASHVRTFHVLTRIWNVKTAQTEVM